MKRIYAIALFIAAAMCTSAFAQAAPAQFCTVTFSTECETKAGNDCGFATGGAPMMPIADVLDNAAKFKKVLDLASKLQEKDGEYTIIMEEVRTCDGGAPARAQGIEVRGVTLDGSNKLFDAAMDAAKATSQKYKDRAAKGAKVGWDHSKAPKVERDDTGHRKQKKT